MNLIESNTMSDIAIHVEDLGKRVSYRRTAAVQSIAGYPH